MNEPIAFVFLSLFDLDDNVLFSMMCIHVKKFFLSIWSRWEEILSI